MSLKSNVARSTLVRRCNYHSERVLSTINESIDVSKKIKLDENKKLNTDKNPAMFDIELESHELEKFDNEKNRLSLGVSMPSTSKEISKFNYSVEDANRFRNLVNMCAKNVLLDEVENL